MGNNDDRKKSLLQRIKESCYSPESFKRVAITTGVFAGMALYALMPAAVAEVEDTLFTDHDHVVIKNLKEPEFQDVTHSDPVNMEDTPKLSEAPQTLSEAQKITAETAILAKPTPPPDDIVKMGFVHTFNGQWKQIKL